MINMTKTLKIILSLCVLCASVVSPVFAGRLHPEKYYQQKWCDRRGGRTEVRLLDRTRCDCLTEKYAIEFDFANKWAEALGQALHYGRMTGRTPGIVLILEKDSDWKYYLRLTRIIRKFNLPVRVWVVEAQSK